MQAPPVTRILFEVSRKPGFWPTRCCWPGSGCTVHWLGKPSPAAAGAAATVLAAGATAGLAGAAATAALPVAAAGAAAASTPGSLGGVPSTLKPASTAPKSTWLPLMEKLLKPDWSFNTLQLGV